ncbi:MAG: hypothetical protein FGF50_11570 [Candidatus Brockarchaeota archaeon]|nr:hypothetical protein [Candidatus Brockarchaeota archaeon]
MRMRPELRKRFIDSLDYLRKMDFFKDYSDLTSEEILERIFSGEISYETQWFVETWPKKEREKEGAYGWSPEEHEDYWMKASVFEVDEEVTFFDVKRVFVEAPKAVIEKGMCRILLKKLARISRDVFNPRYIREEMVEWDEKPPPALGEACFTEGWIFRILFEFRGKEHLVEFYSDGKYLFMNPAVKMINELIKDTGYQYYAIHNEYIVYGVFSEDEAEKLKRERGWKLSLP